MAIILREEGAKKEYFKKLNQNYIYSIKSFEDIEFFKLNFEKRKAQVYKEKEIELIDNVKKLRLSFEELRNLYNKKVDERKKELLKQKSKITSYLAEYNKKNLLYRIINIFKKNIFSRRYKKIENNFEKFSLAPYEELFFKATEIENEIKSKEKYPDKWIKEISKKEINNLNFIHSFIESNNSLYYGAIGEIKACEELKKLPDSYFIINDFKRVFEKPVYDKKNNDHIMSIQVDHVVVGPSGLFLIETKNWSQASMNNLDFFSPVSQIKRSNFAFFCFLNRAIENNSLKNFCKGWGSKKISPQNIILLINSRTNKNFQYVKILSLSELNGYLLSREKIFSEEEISELVEYLKNCCLD